MKSSSPDIALQPTGTGPATADLWNRRSSGINSVMHAAALTGVDVCELSDLSSIALAGSAEASEFLDQMDFLSRTLTSTVANESERCVLSIRGPVQWAETITARANALGNEDVFVCSTSSRSFDTIENRILVTELIAVARAGRVSTGGGLDSFTADEVARARANATRARKWLELGRLKRVSRERLTAREIAKFRRSRRVTRMHAVLAVRDRRSSPFEVSEILAMCDEPTREFHRFALETMEAIDAVKRLPHRLTCFEGALWTGSLSFRHPSSAGGSVPGLAFRGVPLLPPERMLDGAPWARDLPARGIRVSSPRDVNRLMRHLGITSS